jgi:hypothetical protein
LKNLFFALILILILSSCNNKKSISVNLSKDIVSPKTYVVHKATSPLNIDGKADEKDWKNTTFTDEFIDIEGVKKPKQTTKIKMLWDTDFLYVYAKLDEHHIWGDITERDQVIFYNNDIEVFISPSNDTHNYGEIEVNALNTVWDLVLNKPYNVGGKPKNRWNLNDLQTAVFIKGTLNNSTDIDEYWSVEMAIPLSAFAELKNRPKVKPKNGEQWRVNFSRVQWDHDIKDGVYSRKKKDDKFLPEYNWVWSNQGAINMHLPENWGYIHFTDNPPSKPIQFKHQTDVISEQMVYALYRKIAFKDLKHLKKEPTGSQIIFEPITIQNKTLLANFLKTHTGFTLQVINKESQMEYRINETGLIQRKSTK